MPSDKPKVMTYTTEDISEKFKIVAQSENRSVSKQLEYLIKRNIEQYEREHGEISVSRA